MSNDMPLPFGGGPLDSCIGFAMLITAYSKGPVRLSQSSNRTFLFFRWTEFCWFSRSAAAGLSCEYVSNLAIHLFWLAPASRPDGKRAYLGAHDRFWGDSHPTAKLHRWEDAPPDHRPHCTGSAAPTAGQLPDGQTGGEGRVFTHGPASWRRA